jgi:putative transposase
MTYSSDLTENQWELIQQYFDTGNYGKYRTHDKKHLVDAVLYIIKTGSQWHLLPKDYPPYKTVYSFYKRAKDKGIWEKMMGGLVEKSRIKMGRKAQPSYSLIDSQSVKTTGNAMDRGIDGGKKNQGS